MSKLRFIATGLKNEILLDQWFEIPNYNEKITFNVPVVDDNYIPPMIFVYNESNTLCLPTSMYFNDNQVNKTIDITLSYDNSFVHLNKFLEEMTLKKKVKYNIILILQRIVEWLYKE